MCGHLWKKKDFDVFSSRCSCFMRKYRVRLKEEEKKFNKIREFSNRRVRNVTRNETITTAFVEFIFSIRRCLLIFTKRKSFMQWCLLGVSRHNSHVQRTESNKNVIITTGRTTADNRTFSSSVRFGRGEAATDFGLSLTVRIKWIAHDPGAVINRSALLSTKRRD